MKLEDFKAGDLLIVTSRTRRGEERRAAEVTCTNYRGNGLVTYAGRSDPDLLPTGQGAFDPAEVGTKQYGFTVAVEKVGHLPPTRPGGDSGWMFGHPGYDLIHDPVKR